MTFIFMDFDDIYSMRHEFLPSEQVSNSVKMVVKPKNDIRVDY